MSVMTRLAVLALVALSTAPLQASFLSNIGLRNTGVSGANGAQDSNYRYGFGTGANSALAIANAMTDLANAKPAIIREFGNSDNNSSFPFPPWISDSNISSWIGPSNASTHAPGFYVYETTFNLTGYQASQVKIEGRFSVDNRITKVFLNGQVVPGVSYLPPPNVVDGQLYKSWKDFALPVGSGFLSGLNSLVFVTENLTGNTGNPTGLRVEYLAAASSAPLIPEPSTALLFTLGAPLVGLNLRRRFC